MITLTNEGYLPYTSNCLESLANLGIHTLHCYAIGESAYMKLKKRGCQTFMIEDESITQFEEFRGENWPRVTSYKFDIIHDSLQKHDFVLYTDGDIVFKRKGFLKYCKKTIGDNDILLQNDAREDGCDKNLCTGFMLIRSNKKTLEFFNPENIDKTIQSKKGWCDQFYINSVKHRLDYASLPLDLFPNGRYYYDHHETLNPFIIHFNWVIGHNKAKKMVEHQEWYTPDFQDFIAENVAIASN